MSKAFFTVLSAAFLGTSLLFGCATRPYESCLDEEGEPLPRAECNFRATSPEKWEELWFPDDSNKACLEDERNSIEDCIQGCDPNDTTCYKENAAPVENK